MRVPILLALVTFVLLVHSRRTYQRCYCSGGDSPYFLLMARSLALDLDLVMTGDEGSHRLSYLDCPVPLGRRTFSPEIPYITHPIGAPILFALPYRIGGRQGVLIFVACLSDR